MAQSSIKKCRERVAILLFLVEKMSKNSEKEEKNNITR